MAQSGAAESNTLERIIDRLAEFEPTGLPVISVYLNAQAKTATPFVSGRTSSRR